MNNVACLCYYFPPIGGGGTPRSTKFVKYLSQFGYKPTVFTVAPQSHSQSREFRLSPEDSRDLENTEYEAIRVPNPTSQGLRNRLSQSRLYPFIWALAYRWLYEGYRAWAFAAAKQIVQSQTKSRFDVIYASAGPNSSLEAASWASRRLNIPWVADLRDLWTCDSLKFFPSRVHYLWEQRLERCVLRTAAAIIGNTPLSTQRLQELVGPKFAHKVITITNGFDPADFPFPSEAPQAKQPPERAVTILHAGTLYEPGESASRRGRFRPCALNNTARSIVPLLDALVELQKLKPQLAQRFRVRLLGFTPPRTQELIKSSSVKDQFILEGNVPHATAVQAQKDADALLALQVAYQDPDKAVPYVPGKVYEYLATGSPVLAIVPPGDLKDLMVQTPQAVVADYRNKKEVIAALSTLAQRLDLGEPPSADRNWLQQFSRIELTRRLAETFDQATQKAKKTK